MKIIDPDEYPKPRNWNAKVFSMPNIPRGDVDLPESMKMILEALRNRIPYNNIFLIPGSDSKTTLSELCVRLRPMGIVHKTNVGWEISNEANIWLESGDNLYLAAIFSANIRFFAEMLAHLRMPQKSSDLKRIAFESYQIKWETNADINSRLMWLRHLKLVEFQEYTLTYSITKIGIQFLENVVLTKPEEIIITIDSTKDEGEIPVSDWALKITELSQYELSERKQSIGYIPGTKDSLCETVRGYLQLLNAEVSQEIIEDYSQKTYNIKVSSVGSFMTTLTNLNFITRKSRTTYESTALGKKWASTQSEIDFVCCLQSKFLFVFELLKELEKESQTPKELAAIAKVCYGFERENVSEIRTRIHLLESALLIKEDGRDAFCLTSRGKQMMGIVVFQQRQIEPDKNMETESLNNNNYSTKLNDDLTEIRLASRDSSNPDRFQKAIQRGFSLLGFKAEWLGGSGKTDVLLHSPSAPKYAYSVNVDAKSTASGAVFEGQINFDTLNDHRKQHNAEFTAVVGSYFQGDRLVERAKKHGVVLIDIDSFEKMIKMHAEVPLQSDSYKKIFYKPGLVDISLLNEDRNRIVRAGYLLQSIMDCLAEESSDPVTEGFLHERDIYRSLRNQKQFNAPSTLEEITSMLDFLSSPLIGCVGHIKDGYYALGSLTDAANKFGFYAKACVKNN